MENLFYLIPLSGLLAVVFGLMRSKWISNQNPGNEKMQEIGLATVSYTHLTLPTILLV